MKALLREQWRVRGPLVVATGLGLACAAQLASGIAGWWHAPGRQKPVAGDAAAPAVTPGLGALLSARVFGAPAAAEDSAAPSRGSTLVLTGTIATPDRFSGYALIGENISSAALFHTGAAGPGGLRLVEVYVDRAVVERGGVREVLMLPRTWNGSGERVALELERPSVATGPTLSNAQKNRNAMRRDQVRLRDPRGELFTAMPHVGTAGTVDGFRLLPGRDRRRFDASGLKLGDVVTSVNGVPLEMGPDSQKALTSIVTDSTKGSIVTVMRNGTPTEVVVAATTPSG